ncbi:hypothetical protein LTR05_000575 [Lithohypha guttulata]|uniref:Uncharacterized protein n=1 Tax=Lithohypha guttulata TaxID=1690604 RepID=A0AAN7T4Q7_9EURO|nr:hypothetical protein LTR05_000575 [Lithohypha guttulata]
MTNLKSVLRSLSAYSTCDVSDALLKLKHPHGGFIPGITMWSPERQQGDTKIVGPAYTVKFVRNNHENAPKPPQHHIDTIPEGAVVFISAPSGVFNAVYGGLMSARAQYSGAVFARDVSSPAYYEVARPSEVNVPLRLSDPRCEITVSPEDIIFADLNGVVCIPRGLVEQVLSLIPKQVEIDENMAKAIAQGSTFAGASKEFRGK